MSDEDVSKRRDLAEKVMARGAGASVGLGVGGPVGAVVGAIAGVLIEPLVHRMVSELRADEYRRVGRALAAGAESVGLDVEELVERAGRTESSRLLTGQALAAATRTTYEEKIQALGRALAAGVTTDDQTKIDEQQLIIAALADLEVPHVIVLERIVGGCPLVMHRHVDRLSEEVPDPEELPDARCWEDWLLRESLPQLGPLLPSLTGAMQRHGLLLASLADPQVVDRANYAGGLSYGGEGPEPWRPTPLGDQVMALLWDGSAIAKVTARS